MTGHARRYCEVDVETAARIAGGNPIAVIPAGAIEPHGPHLPLATDLLVAEAVAGRAAAAAAADGIDAWLLPPLAYTKSDEHSRFPGALWVRAETLLAQVDDLGRALAASGFGRLLFVNCHGGNSALLEVACREIRRRHGLRTFLFSGPARPGPGERGMGIHAGWAETSMMLHLHPELVEMSRARASVPHAVAECEHVGFSGPVRFGWLADDLSDSGVIGDPTAATAEVGERFVDENVAVVRGALREIAAFEPDPTEPAPLEPGPPGVAAR